MIKNIVTGLAVITLIGCAGYADYSSVAQTPAPADVAGVWMSDGPQKRLASPEAIASLIVNRAGDTLDCRQWQSTIARRGKLTWRGEQLYNVNVKNEYRDITVANGVMSYDGMKLRRAAKPTVECQAHVVYANGDYVFADGGSVQPPAVKSHKKASGVQRKDKKN